MRQTPDFTKLAYRNEFAAASLEDWRRQAEAEGVSLDELVWHTMEQIGVKPLYTHEDIQHMEHLGYVAGLPPYFRGPYPSMYVTQPWTVRQYAGFSTAEESNAFYRRNLAAGQKGLSIATSIK